MHATAVPNFTDAAEAENFFNMSRTEDSSRKVQVMYG